MNDRELRMLRKRWERWYEATKDQGYKRFVPIDPATVIALLDLIEKLRGGIDEVEGTEAQQRLDRSAGGTP